MIRPERAEDVWGGHFVHRLGSRPQNRSTAPLGAGAFFKPVPGFKPQAESYRPVGAKVRPPRLPIHQEGRR
jgi:hypothetical protein